MVEVDSFDWRGSSSFLILLTPPQWKGVTPSPLYEQFFLTLQSINNQSIKKGLQKTQGMKWAEQVGEVMSCRTNIYLRHLPKHPPLDKSEFV